MTIKPQLASTATESQAIRLCADDGWRAEQKLDGQRLIIEIEGQELRGINREGKIIRLSDPIANSFGPFSGTWAFDGELMADGTFWMFDLPLAMDQVKLSTPYGERRMVLDSFYEKVFKDSPYIKLLPSYSTTQDKIDLARKIVKNHGEGVMLKKASAGYYPGKRAKTNFKWKFIKTIDCIVGEVWREGKQSVSVLLLDPETHEMVDVGSIGMTPDNLAKVNRGDVIEVKYLYVENPEAPRLYQASFVKFRDDKSPAECWLTQISDNGFTNKTVVV